jgi:hypothetical protein
VFLPEKGYFLIDGFLTAPMFLLFHAGEKAKNVQKEHGIASVPQTVLIGLADLREH